jgi:hypothetical protein
MAVPVVVVYLYTLSRRLNVRSLASSAKLGLEIRLAGGLVGETLGKFK